LAGGWTRNPLWKTARAVPSLDLRFADNKTLGDAVGGGSLVTFTRASTATFTGSDGLIQTAAANAPRFDHNPTTGESLGLLVEEARTNLCLQSENFSTTWTTFRASVSANATAAPDGNTTADKIVEDTTATNSHGLQQASISFTSGTSYTFSVYVKAAERANIRLTLPAAAFTSALASQFNLALGTTTTISAGATATIAALQSDWYRCTMTATATATVSSTISLQIGENSTSTTVNYTGDGTSGIYAWGAQLEAGAFPTSYIPTTTATVTRAADVASITGSNFSSWYNQTASTIYSEAASSSGAAYTGNIYGFGTSFNDSISHYRQVDFQPVARVRTASVDEYGAIGNGPIWTGTSLNKFAIALATTSGRQASNGALTSGSDDSSIVFPTVSSVSIGSAFTSGYLNGTIKRLTFWPTRLSNTVLQQITQP
jgi:hypothetical protein